MTSWQTVHFQLLLEDRVNNSLLRFNKEKLTARSLLAKRIPGDSFLMPSDFPSYCNIYRGFDVTLLNPGKFCFSSLECKRYNSLGSLTCQKTFSVHIGYFYIHFVNGIVRNINQQQEHFLWGILFSIKSFLKKIMCITINFWRPNILRVFINLHR